MTAELSAVLHYYGNIILRGRPVHDGDAFSYRHPRLSRQSRAAIFAPFAALSGFDTRVKNKEIPYVAKRVLDVDEEWELNVTLFELHQLTLTSRLARMNRVRVSAEYYVPCADPEHEAYGIMGQYRTLSGQVLRVDQEQQCLLLRTDAGKLVIPFADLYRVSRLGDDCTVPRCHNEQ